MKSKAQVSAKEVSDRLSDATGPLDIVFIVAELFESATTDTERLDIASSFFLNDDQT